MAEVRLGEVETRFAEIIWGNEPLSSRTLTELAQKELSWKRSTTYTVLKRLCDRGLFQNVEGTVSALVSKEEFYALQTERYVQETFDGSLPAFLTAFSRRRKLSDGEVEEIKAVIEGMRR